MASSYEKKTIYIAMKEHDNINYHALYCLIIDKNEEIISVY